eukprot:gb/GECG01007830.1/.p1 GENE.gb/GECG01007830.1/~~gb/GECG01007830.1/.p1  ORF type:complete len:318 (+),score=36.03 gb/GECG01007830.1/:1-954(+)
MLQNFNPSADLNDGSCLLAPDLSQGCTCKGALNFDSTADIDDGSCIWPKQGCTYRNASNFDETAQSDDGSCTFTSDKRGCTYKTAFNYDADADVDDGSCIMNDPRLEAKLNTALEELQELRSQLDMRDQELMLTRVRLQEVETTCETGARNVTDSHQAEYTPILLQKQILLFDQPQQVVDGNIIQVHIRRRTLGEDGALPLGTVLMHIWSVEGSAKADLDFSPIDSYAQWDDGETEKVFSICLKRSTRAQNDLQFSVLVEPFVVPGSAIVVSKENPAVLIIKGRSQEIENDTDKLIMQQRIWWAFWSRRLKQGYRPG